MNQVSNVINRLSKLSDVQVYLASTIDYTSAYNQDIKRNGNVINNAAEVRKAKDKVIKDINFNIDMNKQSIDVANKDISELKSYKSGLNSVPDALKALNERIALIEKYISMLGVDNQTLEKLKSEL